ncbi:MAG: FAD:protein FMN transferase [Proteobacteria bacterium]|nr:FAD:protein FMN transferase [Pseudomonadota bacterium]
MLRRRHLLAGGLVVTALPQALRAAPGVQRDSRVLMGTRVDITLDEPDPGRRLAALGAAWAEMQRLEALLSRYRAGNPVAALAHAAGGAPLAVPPELHAVLSAAQAMARRSDGAFDVTVGALDGWDFDPGHPRAPSRADVARALTLVGHDDLHLAPGTAQLRKRGMKLDLGGIAKLPILAAGLATLQAHGVRHAMLNGGGDVLVAGQLQGRPWRIGVRDARAPARLAGTLALTEGFVASSGDYERCFELNGQRYHHILNPRTGQPTAGPHGVALVGRDLAALNGLGAALMVTGSRHGRSLMVPGVDALVFERDAAPWATPGMQRQLG